MLGNVFVVFYYIFWYSTAFTDIHQLENVFPLTTESTNHKASESSVYDTFPLYSSTVFPLSPEMLKKNPYFQGHHSSDA